MIKDQGSPEYEIGSFDAQEFTVERPAESGDPGILNDPDSPTDPSVCSWDFPVIERRTREAEEEDFKAKIARIEKEAYEKGFEQGHKDGLMLEQKKIEEMGKELDSIFTGLNDLKEQIYRESEGEILKMSILIAKKIIGEEIRTNSDIINNSIRSALSFLTDKRRLKIRINPEDMEDVRRTLPDITKITKGGQLQLCEDNAVTRGGCILETGFGRVNATIEDQISILEEMLTAQYQSRQDNTNAHLS